MTEANNSENREGEKPFEVRDGRNDTKAHTRPASKPEAKEKSIVDGAKEATDAVGKTVVAAALAGAVATGAAAVTPDQIHLPDPTPIVQTIDQGVDQPDQVVDDQDTKKASAWKSIWQVLKFVLLALFVAAGFMLAALQGCAACAGPLAAPVQNTASSSQASSADDVANSAMDDAAQASAGSSGGTVSSAA